MKSVYEYCSAWFNTSLAQNLNEKIEAKQSTALKSILGDKYIDNNLAPSHFALETRYERRHEQMLKFVVKCMKCQKVQCHSVKGY